MGLLWILFFVLTFIFGIIGLIRIDTVVKFYKKIGYTYLNSAGREQQPEWWIRLGLKWFLFFAVLVGLLGGVAAIREYLGLGPIEF